MFAPLRQEIERDLLGPSDRIGMFRSTGKAVGGNRTGCLGPIRRRAMTIVSRRLGLRVKSRR